MRKNGRGALEHMQRLMSPALELDEALDALVRAHLVAVRFHRHRGEWRRERSQRST